MTPVVPMGAIVASMLVLGGREASAQQRPTSCDPTRTVSDCWAKFAGTAAAREAPANLAAKSTGADADLPQAETAIRNFLPRLAIAALTPGLSDDQSALGLRLNLPLNGGMLLDLGTTLQLEVVGSKPQVFQSLLDSVPQDRRAGLKDRLDKTLNDYDDVALRAALNLETKRFGRSPRQHYDFIAQVADHILSRAYAGVIADWQDYQRVMSAAQNAMTGDRAAAPECKAPAVTEFAQFRLDCFPAEHQANVEAAAARLVQSSAESERVSAKVLEQGGFYNLVDLINNQPQINGRVEYRSRRDVIGPNAWVGQLRWEIGFANLHSLNRACRRRLGAAGRNLRDEQLADCLGPFVGDAGVRRSLARGDRLWMQVDVTRQNRYAVRLPDDGVAVTLEPTWNVTPAVGYGAYVGQNSDGTDRGRIDLQMQYVVEEKKSKRQDRLVGTATFTQRLTDQSSALITLSYANKSEFLGSVDTKLRAHLGLSYKVLQPKK